MLPVLLTAALLAAPAPTDTRAARLEAYILKRQPRAKAYARLLARSILKEARLRRIDPAIFAAIGWNESWWWWKTSGTSGEFGVWQLWPYGSATSAAWEKLRKEGSIDGFPDKRWRRLGYKVRRAVMQSIRVSTALAALVVRRFLDWCRPRHRVRRHRGLGSRGHRREIDRYAHFNSGIRWPRMGYHYRLRNRAPKIRKALNGR